MIWHKVSDTLCQSETCRKVIFDLKKQGEILIQPVSLNDSEFQFVTDICEFATAHKQELGKQAIHPREKGLVLYVNGDHNLPFGVSAYLSMWTVSCGNGMLMSFFSNADLTATCTSLNTFQ